MTAWGDSELLIELLDRQFAFLKELKGTDQLLRLSRIILFLQSEPQIVAILDDLRCEAEGDLNRYDQTEQLVRDELRSLWRTHGPELRRRLANVTNDDLHAYGRITGFESALEKKTPAYFLNAQGQTPQETTKLINSFVHWWKWSRDLAKESQQALDGEFASLAKTLNGISSNHEFRKHELAEKGRSLAWPAYCRLLENSAASNPKPPNAEDDGTGWGKFLVNKEFAKALFSADEGDLDAVDEMDVREVYRSIESDSKILYEELRLRVGLARSRLGLVRRYAARCEAFDAHRLREECKQNSPNAERILTLDFARFLFDAGLSPLIDPTVSGLRPDLLHLHQTSLFYVEAKQYAKSPRSQLVKAYAQVWSTWARLRKTYAAPEAFLVVFRRSGPWVELPGVIHHEGLKLYSVVADISSEGGSKEKSAPIRLTETELQPESKPE